MTPEKMRKLYPAFGSHAFSNFEEFQATFSIMERAFATPRRMIIGAPRDDEGVRTLESINGIHEHDDGEGSEREEAAGAEEVEEGSCSKEDRDRKNV